MKKFINSVFTTLSIALVVVACAPSPVEQSATQTAIISTSDATKLGLQQTKVAVSTEYAVGTTVAIATYEAERVLIAPPVNVILISHEPTNFILAGDTIEYLEDYEKYDRDLPYEKRAQLRKIYDKNYVYYLLDGETVLLLEYYNGFAKFQFLNNRYSKKTGDIGWVRVTNIKAFATYID